MQEYLAPAGGAIVRVEVLDGRLLYAIKIQTDPEASFNLCPADICQIEPGATQGQCPRRRRAPPATSGRGPSPPPHPPGAARAAAAQRAPRAPPADRALQPSPGDRGAGHRHRARRGLDVGGVEYLVAERDGRHYFYDVNALSNFVTDAPSLLGFDPTARFVDYLLVRARAGAGVGAAV